MAARRSRGLQQVVDNFMLGLTAGWKHQDRLADIQAKKDALKVQMARWEQQAKDNKLKLGIEDRKATAYETLAQANARKADRWVPSGGRGGGGAAAEPGLSPGALDFINMTGGFNTDFSSPQPRQSNTVVVQGSDDSGNTTMEGPPSSGFPDTTIGAATGGRIGKNVGAAFAGGINLGRRSAEYADRQADRQAAWQAARQPTITRGPSTQLPTYEDGGAVGGTSGPGSGYGMIAAPPATLTNGVQRMQAGGVPNPTSPLQRLHELLGLPTRPPVPGQRPSTGTRFSQPDVPSQGKTVDPKQIVPDRWNHDARLPPPRGPQSDFEGSMPDRPPPPPPAFPTQDEHTRQGPTGSVDVDTTAPREWEPQQEAGGNGGGNGGGVARGGGGGGYQARGGLLGDQKRTTQYDPTADRDDPRNTFITNEGTGRVNPMIYEQSQVNGGIQLTRPDQQPFNFRGGGAVPHYQAGGRRLPVPQAGGREYTQASGEGGTGLPPQGGGEDDQAVVAQLDAQWQAEAHAAADANQKAAPARAMAPSDQAGGAPARQHVVVPPLPERDPAWARPPGGQSQFEGSMPPRTSAQASYGDPDFERQSPSPRAAEGNPPLPAFDLRDPAVVKAQTQSEYERNPDRRAILRGEDVPREQEPHRNLPPSRLTGMGTPPAREAPYGSDFEGSMPNREPTPPYGSDFEGSMPNRGAPPAAPSLGRALPPPPGAPARRAGPAGPAGPSPGQAEADRLTRDYPQGQAVEPAPAPGKPGAISTKPPMAQGVAEPQGGYGLAGPGPGLSTNNAARDYIGAGTTFADWALKDAGPQGKQASAALYQGKGAADPQEIAALMLGVDPDSKLPLDKRVEAVAKTVHDFHIAKGDPKMASEAVFNVLQFGVVKSREHGAKALQMAKAGDEQGALKEILAGYAWLADKGSARIDQGNIIVSGDDGTVRATIPLQPGTVANLAAGMASGQLAWDAYRRANGAAAAPPPAKGVDATYPATGSPQAPPGPTRPSAQPSPAPAGPAQPPAGIITQPPQSPPVKAPASAAPGAPRPSAPPTKQAPPAGGGQPAPRSPQISGAAPPKAAGSAAGPTKVSDTSGTPAKGPAAGPTKTRSPEEQAKALKDAEEKHYAENPFEPPPGAVRTKAETGDMKAVGKLLQENQTAYDEALQKLYLQADRSKLTVKERKELLPKRIAEYKAKFEHNRNQIEKRRDTIMAREEGILAKERTAKAERFSTSESDTVATAMEKRWEKLQTPGGRTPEQIAENKRAYDRSLLRYQPTPEERLEQTNLARELYRANDNMTPEKAVDTVYGLTEIPKDGMGHNRQTGKNAASFKAIERLPNGDYVLDTKGGRVIVPEEAYPRLVAARDLNWRNQQNADKEKEVKAREQAKARGDFWKGAGKTAMYFYAPTLPWAIADDLGAFGEGKK